MFVHMIHFLVMHCVCACMCVCTCVCKMWYCEIHSSYWKITLLVVRFPQHYFRVSPDTACISQSILWLLMRWKCKEPGSRRIGFNIIHTKRYVPDINSVVFDCLKISFNRLTHWGQVTYICVSNLTIIGSDNGLSLGRCQAIIWTNAGILLIRTLGTNFSEA